MLNSCQAGIDFLSEDDYVLARLVCTHGRCPGHPYDFGDWLTYQPTLIDGTVADGVARIERKFEGAANLTVIPDSGLKVVLDTLNVRFVFVEWTTPMIVLVRLVRPTGPTAPRSPKLDSCLSHLPLFAGYCAALNRSAIRAADWLTWVPTSVLLEGESERGEKENPGIRDPASLRYDAGSTIRSRMVSCLSGKNEWTHAWNFDS